MAEKEYIISVDSTLFHKCKKNMWDERRGICTFETSTEGITDIECRGCGKTISLSELVKLVD